MSGAFERALEAEHLAGRAERLLRRPGALIEVKGLGYVVRFAPRRRAMLTVDEAAFRMLARDGALAPRREGGWRLVKPLAPPAPPPGRPGVIEGERVVIEGSDQHVVLRANLGESPLAWLARRGGLETVEIAAGERLREDFQKAGTVGRLTMNWDAQPGGSGGPLLEPALRARAAKDRIAAALTAVGPGLREMLERVCLAETALQVAERELGLPRRAGKTVLKLALQRLAMHYRMV
ncbi:hypothetical protein ASD38_07185 [Caulobacter sp. Root487D2Y]|uniref:DUF6456 domain-containing protein n=1 Tax=Caulobacter sp. Root487D2Y TaxID=1736547 RepID=UPI0006F462AE|nr:DUF6456 domain-containing protein [Caulobacter sp. Root487D2Y]KQY31122.1 hypothetical protein ASD38_07185 [Caulobacter sp. Root487D2Y]